MKNTLHKYYDNIFTLMYYWRKNSSKITYTNYLHVLNRLFQSAAKANLYAKYYIWRRLAHFKFAKSNN